MDTKPVQPDYDLSQEIRTMQRLVQKLLALPKTRLKLGQKLRLMDALGEACRQLASLLALQVQFKPGAQAKIDQQVKEVIAEITADWDRLGEENEG